MIVALLLAACTSASAGEASDAALVTDALALLPTVEAARHLTRVHDVAVSVQTPEQLREEIQEEALDEEAQQDLRRASYALQVFELVPPDLDLLKMMLDVLSAQIAAYYDPDRLRLILVSRGDDAGPAGANGAMADMIAAHEWVHALQDQHFDLWALRNRDFHSDDVDTAVLSLVEGDASFAMRPFGGELGDGLDARTGQQMFAMGIAGEDPKLVDPNIGAMPAILRNTLVAPYSWGTRFARALVAEGGWPAIDRAFAHPPLSTEQILHPEIYLDPNATPPSIAAVDDVSTTLGPGWSQVEADAMGELGIRSMLATHSPALTWTARADVAAGWDGDAYQVYRREDGALAAVWVSRWATDRDARALERTAAGWADRFKNGLEVTRQGHDVTVLIGVPTAVAEPVLRAVAHATWTPIVSLDAMAPPRPEPRAALSEAK